MEKERGLDCFGFEPVPWLSRVSWVEFNFQKRRFAGSLGQVMAHHARQQEASGLRFLKKFGADFQVGLVEKAGAKLLNKKWSKWKREMSHWLKAQVDEG